ncbi:hypothetical protein GGS20DRAFT_173211 [Poronia punctata]|nr:hypothetical protein GGS20DRAFT_173211 [Poronia punctata]
MGLTSSVEERIVCPSERAATIQEFVDIVSPLLKETTQPDLSPSPPTIPNFDQVLTSMERVVRALVPERPLFASFHDGQVHDPLGGGSYAFERDVVGPVLRALAKDEEPLSTNARDETPVQTTNPQCSPTHLPTRPIVIHAGLQPNNSPHIGTIVVFCFAFAFARAMRDRVQTLAAARKSTPPLVSVLITFVDTAPVSGQAVESGGIQYQKSHRDTPDALNLYMGDYKEVLQFLSTRSGIPVNIAFQSDLFSSPAMPSLIYYMISQRATLGPQLSPKHGTLALRSACPVPGCGLAEKHGRLNQYEMTGAEGDAAITFHCPNHGPHTCRLSQPAEVSRLEANAPTRNLLRSMTHLLDTSAHHIRITGADYAGMYQETFLYRPLAAWSATTGLVAGRTPHILYAPLIVDWSGAKLSKSLYVREGAYGFLKQLGLNGFCSYAELREQFGGDGAEGLRRIWNEVQHWVANPKKLFRTFSLAYLQRVIMQVDQPKHVVSTT